VQTHGSWRKACQVAAGALASGEIRRSYLERSRERRSAIVDLSYAEAIEIVTRCAHELKRVPSAEDIQHWAAEQRRAARKRGQVVRIPTRKAIERALDRGRSA
jgi:hypothetical protein